MIFERSLKTLLLYDFHVQLHFQATQILSGNYEPGNITMSCHQLNNLKKYMYSYKPQEGIRWLLNFKSVLSCFFMPLLCSTSLGSWKLSRLCSRLSLYYCTFDLCITVIWYAHLPLTSHPVKQINKNNTTSQHVRS